MKHCAHCKTEFSPGHPSRRHCSVSCQFWSKVDVRGEDECWPWTAGISGTGYGNITVEGKTRASHVMAFESENGPVPEGMEVCHSCHNRPCCNPKHLSLGTRQDNAQQMHDAGRHPWSKAA